MNSYPLVYTESCCLAQSHLDLLPIDSVAKSVRPLHPSLLFMSILLRTASAVLWNRAVHWRMSTMAPDITPRFKHAIVLNVPHSITVDSGRMPTRFVYCVRMECSSCDADARDHFGGSLKQHTSTTNEGKWQFQTSCVEVIP